MKTLLISTTIALISSTHTTSSLSPPPPQPTTTRHGWIASTASFLLATTLLPLPAPAAEENVPISDEEMAARVARKQALLKASKPSGGPRDNTLPVGAAMNDIRSDVNPEAGENLRNRSVVENAKIALEKQNEMRGRNKMQKRDDLCEMLGRGC